MSLERDVSLRPITASSRAAVEALTVTPIQSEYVASVADSLVEAAETPDACPWYRAVYVGDAPVGFVMISDGISTDDPAYLGPYFLWRLLIDEGQQGKGFGRATVALVMEYLATRPGFRVLLTSVHEGPDAPLGFYLKLGFRETGTWHEGERVLELHR